MFQIVHPNTGRNITLPIIFIDFVTRARCSTYASKAKGTGMERLCLQLLGIDSTYISDSTVVGLQGGKYITIIQCPAYCRITAKQGHANTFLLHPDHLFSLINYFVLAGSMSKLPMWLFNFEFQINILHVANHYHYHFHYFY